MPPPPILRPGAATAIKRSQEKSYGYKKSFNCLGADYMESFQPGLKTRALSINSARPVKLEGGPFSLGSSRDVGQIFPLIPRQKFWPRQDVCRVTASFAGPRCVMGRSRSGGRHSRTQSPSYARCDEGLWPNPKPETIKTW